MEREKFIRLFNQSSDHLNLKRLKKIIRRSIIRFRERSNMEHCYLILAEELSELTQQISKAGRGIPDSIGITEEISDSIIAILYLQELQKIPTNDIYRAINVKVDRLEEKLNTLGVYL